MTAAHVLVVEDNALVASAMRLLLEDAGYTVSEAATVAGAIGAVEAASRPPDVALLDLTLPDGDGLTILSELRGRGREPRITVAVTGRDDPPSGSGAWPQAAEMCCSSRCRRGNFPVSSPRGSPPDDATLRAGRAGTPA